MFPNQTTTTIALNYPSYGTSPAGFPRLHVEMMPKEVGRLIGYDPRTLVMKPKRTGSKTARGTRDLTPHNVAPAIVQLQNQVQRSIDSARVASMVQYLHSAMESGAFADFGPIEVVTASRPDTSRLANEHLVLMDSDADYFIADGQHRYCAIMDFVREYPQYAERFTQPITISILPEDKLALWAGQAFHDRNYFAVAVRAGKALSVDSRDPVNALAKDLATHPSIKAAGGIAYERDTLLRGDTRFTTHSVLHRFVKGFLFGRSGLDRSTDQRADIGPSETAALRNFIGMLAAVMPWTGEDRELYLARASVVLSALAVIGHDLYTGDYSQSRIEQAVRFLGAMDWRRANLEWAGILGSEKDGQVQPASSRPVIDGTIRYLRDRLGLQKSGPVLVPDNE